MTVLIIGASVAGVRTAQALRQRGFQEHITLLGEEPHQPYDKPALSKEVLAAHLPGEPPSLPTQEQAEELGVGLLLGTKAIGLDLNGRSVLTDSGERLPFHRLVVATGVTPRTMPGAETLDGIHTLRTIDDALALRAGLDRGPRVVVIGAGFIGAEFASAARSRGLDVCVVEAQRTPMAHLFGERVGRMLAGIHAVNGVAVESGVGVGRFTDDGRGRVTGVRTDTHARLLRERADEIDQLADHAPQPIGQRLRTNANRLRTTADTHDATAQPAEALT